MLDALYPLFSIFSFLGFILVLLPLPWHFQTRIPGICFYIMWSAIACLNQFVNSVVWKEDSILRAPVWCDISMRIMMGVSVGIPAATLCINRRLYQIASTNGSLSSSKAELRRSVFIDGLLCVFFPLVYIALQFIVQAHRFDIYEQIGCYPALYNSIPLYFLSTIWPPLISLISTAYGALTLHSFLTRRATLSDSLASMTHLITLSRYLRMLTLATLSTLLTLSLGIFTIYSTATSTPIHPWRSLSITHSNFSHIDSIPALVWRSDPRLRVALEFTRWTVPVPAILFFVFFGVAVEARTNYRLALSSACNFLRLPRLGGGKSASPQEKPSSSASKEKFALGAGVGFTKPLAPTINTQDISPPAYTSSSGSLTVGSFGADMSRVRSFTSTTSYASDSSRFVEHLDPHAKPHDVQTNSDIIIISPIYSADALAHEHADLNSGTPPPPSPASFVLTPASATSFASSTSSGSSYTLPSHVGWHAEAYPASPSSVAHPYAGDEEDVDEELSSYIHSASDIEVPPPAQILASSLQL